MSVSLCSSCLFCKATLYFKIEKKNHGSLKAIYHSDESDKVLLESRVFVAHFNTSKTSVVIPEFFDLISVIARSFKH